MIVNFESKIKVSPNIVSKLNNDRESNKETGGSRKGDKDVADADPGRRSIGLNGGSGRGPHAAGGA